MRLAVALLVFSGLPAHASQAPPGIREFNVTCPAARLLPQLDLAYHECNNYYQNGSCENFVSYFKSLIPEYDCQRPGDVTPEGKFVVPGIWLAGDGALEDYIALLFRLASHSDKVFNHRGFKEASAMAHKLFTSKEFPSVLDGGLAEDYRPLVEKLRKRTNKGSTK